MALVLAAREGVAVVVRGVSLGVLTRLGRVQAEISRAGRARAQSGRARSGEDEVGAARRLLRVSVRVGLSLRVRREGGRCLEGGGGGGAVLLGAGGGGAAGAEVAQRGGEGGRGDLTALEFLERKNREEEVLEM